MVDMSNVRITHTPSGTVLAEGPIGWGVTPFEGNYYVRKKYLKTDQMRVNYLAGLRIYKFLYVWMDLHLSDGLRVRSVGWMHWLPNPLFPFIWFRVAVPKRHAEIEIEGI